MDWFDSEYEGQVSARALNADFFKILECINSSIKDRIFHGDPLFFEGYAFYRVDWEANFNGETHCPQKYPQWISLENLPSEFWSEEILERIGQSFGNIIGFEEEFFVGRSWIVKLLIKRHEF
ncbi:hypothetical protein SUGI_1016860 [Cryptomeria japonica]|nr:hypothetical protein SUGI_1016860 [Cryptomeria japonica]